MQDKSTIFVTIFFIVVTIVILLLVGFIISILFLYLRKQHRFSKDVETMRLNYDRELFKAQLEIQEQTFQYISQEIHDNVGQFLSLAKLNLNTLDFENKDVLTEQVNRSTDLLTQALDDLRDLSKSLSSDLIKNVGLNKAIELQIGQLQKAGNYHVVFDVKGNYHYLDDQKEIILFRILQEAINNIVRHSFAREVIVLLSCIDNHVKLYIQDDGEGFDTSFLNNKKTTSSGIRNMRKRARLINGDLEIESAPGMGTKITITAPIKTHDKSNNNGHDV
jgi:signal transduction histidine kinase